MAAGTGRWPPGCSDSGVWKGEIGPVPLSPNGGRPGISGRPLPTGCHGRGRGDLSGRQGLGHALTGSVAESLQDPPKWGQDGSPPNPPPAPDCPVIPISLRWVEGWWRRPTPRGALCAVRSSAGTALRTSGRVGKAPRSKAHAQAPVKFFSFSDTRALFAR